MPERQKTFSEMLVNKAGRAGGDDPEKSFTSERQHTAQAFNLHVERRDGRHSEGFAWSHYAGYQWKDEGEQERLVVMFGTRAIEIEGHHLGVLVEEIREGQLNSIRELTTAQKTLLANDNPERQPVINSVKMYPDFDELLKELKGDDRDPGFAGKVRGR